MFWANRLKQTDADADGTWVLSYGDLMTLLLVIFVMIAAMSELQGDRFGKISSGVRQAFGFAGPGGAGQSGMLASVHSPTLLERLEAAGFRRESSVQLVGPDNEKLAVCDVLVGERDITVRIAGHASFARDSAALEPAAEKALRRIAEYLAGGTTRIEVRGHAEAGPLAADAPFRDGMDLSYARARAVAEVLGQFGVARERLMITAWADTDPLTPASVGSEAGAQGVEASASLPEGADRRIEIVVHAVTTAGHEQQIAGKDTRKDG